MFESLCYVKGKNGETSCVEGTLQKCKKGRWTETGSPCPIPPISLVEKAGPCLLVNTDCRDSANVISSSTSSSSLRCGKPGKDLPK